MTITIWLSVLVVGAVLMAGCGGASRHTATVTTSSALPTTTEPTPTVTSSDLPKVPPLQAEATSAAAGDIPDNQVFLTYRSPQFSMKYPEGWVQSGRGGRVTFRDKNNIVRVLLGHGVVAAAGGTVATPPKPVALAAGRAQKMVYRTVSTPNPVTGKRITLTVDRYTISGAHGKQAVVDLGTPVGVDNVDAYRLMVESFRWR